MEFTRNRPFGPGQTGYLPLEDEYLSLLLLEKSLGGAGWFGGAWEDEDDYGYYGDDEYE